MKSLIDLAATLLADASRLCSVDTSRDLETIRSRAGNEGLSFLTITLGEFAADFERGLAESSLNSTHFAGWQKRGRLPKFLWGFTSLVFDKSGGLKDAANITAISCVRQICRAFKKVEFPCASARVDSAFQKYLDNETAMAKFTLHRDDRYTHFLSVSDFLWRSVFGSEFSIFGLVPKHGPGATAERISGNAKYRTVKWHERLERSFPVTEFGFCNLNHVLDDHEGLSALEFVEDAHEQPVRVITVPKTLKAPRIIAIEPVCMQYTQQALARYIIKMIERSPLTRKSIRFSDQTVNQQLAMHASQTGHLATLDLSDASDRVPLSVVKDMLRSCPELLDAILDCRSTRAELPKGTILSLEKFASMGSALCFPIEAMYFYTIIVHELLWKKRQDPCREAILHAASRTNIYGDDIIVPVSETDSVISALAYFNCKVNTSKSFWTGRFRESCGCDAYAGIDVTPVYVRHLRPETRRDAARLASWVSTSNQFHEVGFWLTADFMKNEVEKILGKLPVVLKSSPGLGWVSFQGYPTSYRQCIHLHCPIVYTYRIRVVKRKDPLDGYSALHKFFLRSSGSSEPATIDKKHLEWTARDGVVSRKRHWVPVS